MRIDNKVFMQELRDQALALADNSDQQWNWKAAYQELASVADKIHAMYRRMDADLCYIETLKRQNDKSTTE